MVKRLTYFFSEYSFTTFMIMGFLMTAFSCWVMVNQGAGLTLGYINNMFLGCVRHTLVSAAVLFTLERVCTKKLEVDR